jgi:hypothetical protein
MCAIMTGTESRVGAGDVRRGVIARRDPRSKSRATRPRPLLKSEKIENISLFDRRVSGITRLTERCESEEISPTAVADTLPGTWHARTFLVFGFSSAFEIGRSPRVFSSALSVCPGFDRSSRTRRRAPVNRPGCGSSGYSSTARGRGATSCHARPRPSDRRCPARRRSTFRAPAALRLGLAIPKGTACEIEKESRVALVEKF